MKTFDSRPNILLVFTDQQRFDTIQALGSSFSAQTPVMDELAARGTAFSQCCCTAPVCSPSRSSLMTGRYPAQVGMPCNLFCPSPPLSRHFATIGDHLQSAGYETIYHGKWHLGGNISDYGFESAGECSYDEDTRRMASRYWRDRDWLGYHRPFFHVVSFLDPHDLYFYDPEKPEPDFQRPWSNTRTVDEGVPPVVEECMVDWDESRWGAYHRYYEERIERVDTELGNLLEELRNSGFYNNTWIIFCSDHGDMAGEHDIPFKGPYLYDGTVRVPLIIVPPQRRFVGADREGLMAHTLSPSRQDGLCSLLDVPATILDLAGVERPTEWQGTSLLPWVRQEAESSPHARVFASWGGPQIDMVRTPDWKYIRFEDGSEQLFDLKADPQESRNRVSDAEQSSTLAEMRVWLDEYVAANQSI